MTQKAENGVQDKKVHKRSSLMVYQADNFLKAVLSMFPFKFSSPSAHLLWGGGGVLI
jgi:hypothetical protein